MAVEQYPVEVQSDFLEKITRARPVPALAELDNKIKQQSMKGNQPLPESLCMLAAASFS